MSIQKLIEQNILLGFNCCEYFISEIMLNPTNILFGRMYSIVGLRNAGLTCQNWVVISIFKMVCKVPRQQRIKQKFNWIKCTIINSNMCFLRVKWHLSNFYYWKNVILLRNVFFLSILNRIAVKNCFDSYESTGRGERKINSVILTQKQNVWWNGFLFRCEIAHKYQKTYVWCQSVPTRPNTDFQFSFNLLHIG